MTYDKTDPTAEGSTTVIRHLKLEQTSDSAIEIVCADISATHGVDHVEFDHEKNVLSLTYNANRVRLDGLEAVLGKHGVEIAHDWWTNLKEKFYVAVDENIAANSQQEPHCCHTPNKTKDS